MAERKQKHPNNQEQPVDEHAAVQGEAHNEEVITGFRDKASPEEGAATPPSVPLEEFEALQEKLEKSEAKAKDYFDGWQRERADFANYKKRIDRDHANLSQNIASEVIKKYLLVLDDMDRAMKFRPTDGDVAAWADGIELIYRKLQSILDAEGIKRIPAESEEFDPMRHEAISIEDSPDHESGQVIAVVQEGYTLGERVLRPARVRVAR